MWSTPLYLLTVFGSLLVVVCCMNWWLRRRFRHVAASRQGESYDDFCHDFAGLVISPVVMAATYHELQDWFAYDVNAFPVRAVDNIGNVYGIVGGDLDDLTKSIAEKSCIRLPKSNWPKVVTVFDLVNFLSGCENKIDN